jgi:hypothetical protein
MNTPDDPIIIGEYDVKWFCPICERDRDGLILVWSNGAVVFECGDDDCRVCTTVKEPIRVRVTVDGQIEKVEEYL